MKRSPLALALTAALGLGVALPASPALAQQGASMTVMPIRTGSSSIPGTFGVRLAVYDARSFELSWNRVANAVTYRLAVGGRTVQENGAVSRYVAGVGLSGGFDYTLSALNRVGTVIATERFRVQPASATQLVASDGTAAPTNPTPPVEGPGRPRDTPAAPQALRGQLYSSSAGEVFWQRIPGALLSYEIRLGGQVVATTNGTSYFIGNRPGLSGTAVEVVAVSRLNGRRSNASSVTLGGGASNPMAPVTPMNPATGSIHTGVSNLGGDFPVRLNVYDAQSFELSWERVPGAATYRLSRGGQVVQESNGLSRYVSGIDSSASFAYTLVALDRSGNALRSTSFAVSPRAATQLVAGGGTSTPTMNSGPIRTGQTSLAGDINVRLSVYDVKAYELFWDRVPGAVRYRLSRGGQVVQESDAVSYFVGMADSTQRFAYTLAALDRSGNTLRTRAFTVAPRGTPQLVAATGGTSAPTTPTPAAPGQGDALPPQVQARLTTLFQVAGGDVLEVGYALGERLDTLVQNGGLNQVSTFTDESGNPGVRYACPQGGTVDAVRRTISGSRLSDFVADACAAGPLTVDGRLSGSTTFGRGSTPEGTKSWNFEGYTLSDSRNGGSEASLALGTATLPIGGVGAIPNDSERPNLLATGLGLTAGRDGSYSAASATVNGRNTVESDPSEQRGLTFRADTLRSSQFADAQVLTTTPFVRDDRSENYRTGSLRVTGTTDFVYDLNADNGDPASFQLDVIANGSTTSYTVPWSAAFSFDRFDPSTANLGF